jgi:hypothetical protein
LLPDAFEKHLTDIISYFVRSDFPVKDDLRQAHIMNHTKDALPDGPGGNVLAYLAVLYTFFDNCFDQPE